MSRREEVSEILENEALNAFLAKVQGFPLFPPTWVEEELLQEAKAEWPVRLTTRRK